MTDVLKRDVFLKFISWMLILLLVFAGLTVTSRSDAKDFPGDGYEYLMMPVSIMNHGSTSVTEKDIDDAKAYYGSEVFETIYRTRSETTLVSGNDGNFYAKHYYLYSVLCMPLRGLFHAAGVNPARAFLLMNLFFWLVSCLFVQLVLEAEQWKKTLIMLFVVLNPVWFYLTWVHTEVLMFSLVVISLVFRYNGKYIPSMLFMSIAAMNNLGLLVPAFILGIDFLFHTYKKSDKKISVTLKKTLPILACAIPGFIPVIRSFILFNSYSPVASVASVENSEFPTDSRLLCGLSYIIDPNQGMIAYTFLIVPAFIVICVINLVKRRNTAETIFNLLVIIGILFVVAQELHINCGMSYIMRYNIWILPFMAFFDVFNMKPLPASFVLSLSSVWTLGVVIFFTLTSAPDLYLGFTPFGKFMMENLTSVYNPPVGIFYSRTLTSETYYSEYPVGYFDDEGNLCKILVTPQASELLDEGKWTIFDPSGAIVDYRDLDTTNINGSDFTYVNITRDGYHLVEDTDTLDFSDLKDTDNPVILSSVGFEGDNALIYGNELDLRIRTTPGTYTGRFYLTNVFGGIQNVMVRADGEPVYEGIVSMDDEYFEFEFEVDDGYFCDIEVLVPGALSPVSVIPESTDDRVLSLYITEFTYEET